MTTFLFLILPFVAYLALVIVGAFYLTVHRRRQRAFANVNDAKRGTPQNVIWMPCPSAITSGMPVLLGTIAAVAMDAYDSTTLGTTFMTDGAFFLTVTGQSTQSPNSVQTIARGDQLFASGTLDATTNVTYNLTIDKTRGNVSFGNYIGAASITAGVTDTNAIVRLKIGA